MQAWFANLRNEARVAETSVFLVVGGEAEPALNEGTLWDPAGRLAATFGVDGAALVVVDPAGRLAAILPGDASVQALALCRSLFVDLPVIGVNQQAPTLLIPRVLEADQCEALIAYWQRKEKTEDRVANTGYGHQHRKATVKKRADVVVADEGIFEMVKGQLAKRVVPAIGQAFQTEVKGFEALRIGCYESSSGGHFARHHDDTTPYTAHRQFAMSLNLNDGYQGGQVQFPEFGRALYCPPAGGAIVFSCSLLHEVLPMTRGRRFALFTFLFDAAGAERERQLQQELIARGETGVSADT